MSYKHAILQPGVFQKPPFSVEVPDSPIIEGETIPRVHPACINGVFSVPEEGVNTLFDVLLRSKANFGDLPGFGTRKLIEEHQEIKKVRRVVEGEEVLEEKKWIFFEMGPYEWVTFGEYVDLVLKIGSGYRKLGLVPGDKLHVFAGTSMHWLASAHAAATQSIPIVTSYATLGESGLTTSLTQTNARAIFTDPSLLPKLINPLITATSVDFIIYNSLTPLPASTFSSLQSTHPKLTIISLGEVQNLGESNPVEPTPPKSSDLCCVMYTSGTTGTPKGVPLTHGNVIAALAGLDVVFSEFISPADSVLAYLPLSHSFEYAVENACIFWGLRLGYGSPRTLSNTSMRHCDGDLKEFKPSIMVGVPAIWETVRKGIESQVAASGSVTSGVFWGALKLKEFLCAWHLPGPGTLDHLVFKGVKDETGGRLRACFNGAGALGEETRRFISLAIAPMVGGYGLTETCTMGLLQSPLQWTTNTLGAPSGSVEIKLLSVPELNYFTSNTPPRGEVLIRGPAVMSGYWNSSDGSDLLPGGWFRTGDVGTWSASGHMMIIDRIKNLIKVLGGEYIALEKLESVYQTCGLVSNICIVASESRSRPIAIVVPAWKTLRLVLDEELLEVGALVKMKETRDLVLKDLQAVGRKAGLAGFEIVEGVVVSPFQWTVEDGCLTPAQKLNRRTIVPLYKKEIDGLYGKSRSVL